MPRRRFSQGAIQPLKAILQEIEDEENARQSTYGKKVAANHYDSTSASCTENVRRKKKKSAPGTQLLPDKSAGSSHVMADINDEVFHERTIMGES